MIVYKMVKVQARQRDGNYCSLVQEIERGLGLRYKIGKTTVPEIGLIFAYRTAKEAREWVGVLLKCETPQVKPLRYIASWDEPNDQVLFWLKEKVKLTFTTDNMVGCPELTPIEVIQ